MRVLPALVERLSETTAVTAFFFLPPRRSPRFCFRRSTVYCTAFASRQLIFTIKKGRRRRPDYGCIKKFHGALGVCEDTPLFSHPCPPLSRPRLTAEPVLSFIAAIPPSPAAPASRHVVPAKAHGIRPRPSCSTPFCPPCRCCRGLLRLQLQFRRRRRGRQLQLLRLLLLRDCPGALVV